MAATWLALIWRVRAMRILCAAVALLAGHAADGRAETKLAFVVGIDIYPKLAADAQLRHAVNDADALSATLEGIGFSVTKVTDDTRLSTVLSRFGQFVARITPGDTAVFYFAGHGIALDDGTYLLPSDVPALGPTDQLLAKRAALSEREISDGIRGSGARAVIIILDACRDNPFPRKGLRSLGSATRGLARLTTTEGVFTLYSAREGQTAMDTLSETDTDPNSVFTRTLIKDLKTPGLSLSELGERVRDEVAALTRSVGHDQVPSVSNDLIGARTLILVGGTDTADGTKPRSDPARERAKTPEPPFCARSVAYDTAIQTPGPDALRDYLQRCASEGPYHDVATEEFESRLFLAASECIRRAPGCDFDSCVALYATDRPDGARLDTLKTQATRQAAARSACRPREPDRAEAVPPPAWCRSGAALKPTETLICARTGLADLDARLNQVYGDHLRALSGPRRAAFVSGESAWVVSRDRRCGSLATQAMATCLSDAMERRIADLAGGGGAEGAPTVEADTTPVDPPAWCRASKRLKRTEELICSTPQLARLDARLNEAFAGRLRSVPGSGRARLIGSEQDWLAERDGRCGILSAPAVKDCLVKMMRARIASFED